MAERHRIPARRGVAHRVERGQRVRVVNTHGTQVVDFWAFNADDLAECLSMEHTRVAIGRLVPRVGDVLVTNRRRPILAMLEDTSPGAHDTLIAACDVHRYAQLGHAGYHDNCTDNLAAALEAIGLHRRVMPCPLNLFMNIPVGADRSLSFEPPLSRPGDSVTFRAEMDVVVAFSACPQDLLPVNGRDCVVRDAHYEVT